ncbi:MAG: hypothetical protein COT81_01615 [Candidatus Buchananbacteria bacterium CG10_big_fil_rev_8_21_14_0_10_42_9]|uniref:6-phosphogluconate dehydrogenase C-terminal domain-containing protein n=1 Tax=Candidatus Buchananbacteria bacterium CG10_big_fil_rev_8_21_14_0_10_42_9 TaxID=1974526 RepID=A0A2H0W1U8_9BACT|nr:MAG: hypothetical protein COT81_01615 [Candidatus Buchananbacteria bacterium CG10_big_fil_rev_8_21_14_0_10_42_9]
MVAKIKPNVPTILVVFGATGDLMAKKIVPALFLLHQAGELPKMFRVQGYSRRDLNDEKFRSHVYGILKKKKFTRSRKPVQKFLDLFHFQQGSFGRHQDYVNLAEHLGAVDGEWKVCANKLFYLAVAPEHVETIVKNLKRSKLTDLCSDEIGWSRVIVEKPFGENLKSAGKLDELLASLFKEEQIYRIDHYLAKEMLQNILTFRFGNNLFEANWNNKYIESIDMKLWESIGVEDRGVFYDKVGALRDVGQNHMLQMIALITMNNPASQDPTQIRKARSRILQTLHRPTQREAKDMSFRAQYTGYKGIKGVKRGSKASTYFKLQTFLEHPRWRGVPITIESGKRMGRVRKEIEVLFKHPTPCLCPPGKHFQNRVIFSIQPNTGIRVEFWSKRPGFKPQLEKRRLKYFLYKEENKTQYVQEYAKLLLDCINGDQTLFVSTHEIRAMWRMIDPFMEAWKKDLVPLESYKPNRYSISTQADKVLAAHQPHGDKRIGIIGLGRMGANLARNLLAQGWDIVGYDRTPDDIPDVVERGLRLTKSIPELIEKMPKPRLIWLMVPAGKPVDDVLFGKGGLVGLLSKGDTIIDGGNSFYKNTLKRARKVKQRGINFLDCGVSGGPSGARRGACLMVGGDKKIFLKHEKLFQDMAIAQGYQFFEGYGAGHFVKMVHNGIEYGMMQAIGEGFHVLKKSKFNLDLKRASNVYNHGSVIESRLVGWLIDAYRKYGVSLEKVDGRVSHTGEGEWTIKAAKELRVPVKVIEDSFRFRVQSGKNPTYTGQVVSALRGEFGRHPVLKRPVKKERKKK